MKSYIPITRKPHMKPPRGYLAAAFDTETRGLDGEFLMGQLYHENWQDAETYETAEALMDGLLGLERKILQRTIWYAHNGEYDWRYIISAIVARQYDLDLRERAAGKFYEIIVLSQTEKTKAGKPVVITRFRDSMAVFPFSLKEFTKQFAPEHAKTDIGLASGVEFNPRNATHKQYAKNDVIGLVKAVINFDSLIFKNFFVHLKGTTSGTAYQSWLRFAPDGEYHDRQSTHIERFLRTCYHGGLVSLNAIAGHSYAKVYTLDINSSYPANMRDCGVPKGKGVRTYEYKAGFPGFYKTCATVPDNAILPIVPFRSERGQLAWPTGTFTSFLSSAEIDYCRTLGCTFKIIKGVYFPDGLSFCFSEFIDVCERLRTEFKGTPTETTVKLMQNSLYGRFGMREAGRECLISTDGQPLDMDAVYDPVTNATIPYAFYKNVVREAEYMLPHYSAWITANARILLDKGTEAAGRENVLYRDTDSVHTVAGVENMGGLIGKAYGQFKLEKDKTAVIYHAAKCYTYMDDKDIMQATYKGIPASLIRLPDKDDRLYAAKLAARTELLRALHAGEHVEVEYHSSTSLQTFLSKGRMSYIRRRRPTDPSHMYGHRIEGGKFRPRIVNE